MGTQQIIQRGYRWQVGNGDSISVWTDKWLPTSSTFCITSQPHPLPTSSRVNSLIDHETRQWRISFIKEIFPPHDAQAILNIPLSHTLPPNRIIWAYMPRGLFSVSSAYKVALSISSSISTSHDGPSNNENTSVFWRTLWRLHIPNKIWSFAWKACKNVLPTKTNLCSRKIIDDPTCKICGVEAETSGHALWDCPNAREVWVSSIIPIQHHGLQFDAFTDLIWHLMLAQHVGDELLGIIITLAWSIWHNRNTARTGGARQTCTSIIQKAMLLLEEYQIANHKIKLPVAPHNVTWSPPSNSWYKINADGAVFNSVVKSALKV